MDRQRRTSQIYKRVVKSFAQLNPRDSYLPVLLMTWLLGASWAVSICLLGTSEPNKMWLGSIGFVATSVLSFLPIRIMKNYLHRLFLSASTKGFEAFNSPKTKVYTASTDEGQHTKNDPREELAEYPNDDRFPKLIPPSAN